MGVQIDYPISDHCKNCKQLEKKCYCRLFWKYYPSDSFYLRYCNKNKKEKIYPNIIHDALGEY